MPLSVRCGGHGIAGTSVVEDGILVDLSSMKGVHVDVERGTAIAQAGVLWGEYDRETELFGRATPGGRVTTTGVGGFCLGGGYGWASAAYGLTCDNLVAADVVTADGRLVHASDDENPDLMWGLRGGGGNFGIATSLEYELHPVGPMVMAGPIFFAGDRAEEILRFYRGWVRELPDELTTLVNLTTAPPAPFLPEAVHGKPLVAIVAVGAGEHEVAGALLQPVRDLGDPVADLIGAIPYTAMQSLLDPLWARGAHNYFRSSFVDEVDDAAVAALVEAHRAVPSPMSEIHLQHFGGAIARVRDDHAAFGDRSAQFVLNAIARTPDAGGFDDSVAWARRTVDALAPVSRPGAYTNFMGDASDLRLRDSYGAAKYERLVALKRRYDPDNLFARNQNIAP
jgi:FAD/FMN-containing dehydrogenase